MIRSNGGVASFDNRGVPKLTQMGSEIVQDYDEENQRPSTKRDQKITYSRTSLDELQFL